MVDTEKLHRIFNDVCGTNNPQFRAAALQCNARDKLTKKKYIGILLKTISFEKRQFFTKRMAAPCT